MPTYNHYIGDMTASELQSYLNNTVDRNWKHGDLHQFYRLQSDIGFSPVFTIKVVNKRKDGTSYKQIGNGCVFNIVGEAQTWKYHKPDLQNSLFPNSRNDFFNKYKKLSHVDFTHRHTQALILLALEEARRKNAEDFPISRKEIADAIDFAMENHNDGNVRKKVN